MAQFSSGLQQAVAFLASLGKQLTEGSQYPFESKYRALPNIPNNVVWSETVDYSGDAASADAFTLANPTIVKKYTLKSLTAIPGSNNQAWYIDDVGQFVTSWISPSDIPDVTTNEPSYGYQANLYTSSNSLIAPTQGKWNIFYSQGIVLFELGSTPIDLAWGIPKITCYTYIGAKGGTSTPPIISSSSLEDTIISGTSISALRAVTVDPITNKAIYASSNIPSHAGKIIAISKNSAILNSTLDLHIGGTMTDAGWNWDVDLPIFLGNNGLLTQTVPSSPTDSFRQILAYPKSPTTILFEPSECIKLI